MRDVRAFGVTRFGGPECQAFLDLDEPRPGPDEVVVRVRAAGVNPGDRRLREGEYDVEVPAVLGREVAGTVVGIGADVADPAVGDEVFGGCPGMVGGFAAVARVTASFCARRPGDVAPEAAAVLPVAAGTAFDALEGLALPPGSTLLVTGAGGGVGLALLQLARLRGVRVVGTARAAKHELVSGFGAVAVESGDGLLDRVREAIPDGVDAVFDLVGGDVLRSVATLAPAGRLVSVADKPLVRELGGRDVVRDRSSAVLTELARLVAAGELDPCVTEAYPFDDAAAAMAAVESGRARGKVVVTFG